MTGYDNRSEHVARCVCGHNQRRHEGPGFDGECVADGCRCELWRPVSTVTAAAPPVVAAPAPRPSSPVSVEQVVQAARVYGDKRARLVADRVEHLTAELRALLAAAAARARDEAAQAQIRELPTARVQGQQRRKPTIERGEFPCPDCGKVFETRQGVGPHRRKAHGYRRGDAA